MTINETYNFFESLLSQPNKKSDIKIYEEFLEILTHLKNRGLSEDEIQSIERELKSLNLKSNPENRKKYFKKALSTFEKYLKDTFSLTSKGYYTKLYSGLGVGFGILFGVVFLSSWERSLGISMGLIFGYTIGMLIGRNLDNQAEKENRVLKVSQS